MDSFLLSQAKIKYQQHVNDDTLISYVRERVTAGDCWQAYSAIRPN